MRYMGCISVYRRYFAITLDVMYFRNNPHASNVRFQFFYPLPCISKCDRMATIANVLPTKFGLKFIFLTLYTSVRFSRFQDALSSYFSDPHVLNRFINTTLAPNFSKHHFEQLLDHKSICTFLSVTFSDCAIPIFRSLLSCNTR